MVTGSLNSPDTLVPRRSFYDEYVSREVGPNTSEFDVFNYALENKLNVLFEGPTGNGKTSASLAFAALKAMPFYAVQCNGGADPSQIVGHLVQNKEGKWVWQDGGLTALFRLSQTRACLLLLNEINFMSPKLAPLVFSALDKRRSITVVDNMGEVIEAGELLIVADKNDDDAGYTGTRPLNHALRNRFHVKLRLGYDSAVEEQLVESKSLRAMARRLRDRADSGDHSTPVSTNSLIEFEQLAKGLSLDFACENFMNMFPADYRGAVVRIIELEKANIERDYNPQPEEPASQTVNPIIAQPIIDMTGDSSRQDMSLEDFLKSKIRRNVQKFGVGAIHGTDLLADTRRKIAVEMGTLGEAVPERRQGDVR